MNPALAFFLLITSAIVLVFFRRKWLQQTKIIVQPFSDDDRKILEHQVAFYQNLSKNDKTAFENRVQEFLLKIKITGVGTSVEPLDRMLIGASAIIPIFRFPQWKYTDLHEVLLYPSTFNQKFSQQGDNRDVLGMVGDGAMNDIMILSKPALRNGFANSMDRSNTGIHEFVHLIDKTDGITDGIPEVLLTHQYVLPWIQAMHKNIADIAKQHSDINPYAATNQAEFFAVVSEYFFERPDLLKERHPDLYSLLEKAFAGSSEPEMR
ncbi:MAG: zinc-dependent peptidase [Bacteroidetes bacterium]|nr:zinc-dependent peptidase [Bacteroidota bacterium]MBS1741306.1 zinc-dependent peptidase [Bacteroidota bacterium]